MKYLHNYLWLSAGILVGLAVKDWLELLLSK